MPSELATTAGVPEEALIYGDPCMSADWAETITECKNAAKGGNGEFLARDVLVTFGININEGTSPGSNAYTGLCPLDLFNQDPFAVIRASLDALLVDMQYWEVYADEYGQARFVLILDSGNVPNPSSDLANVRYCIPNMTADDLANLVIIRGSTGVPNFMCGDQYVEVFNTAQPIFQDICGGVNIFTLNNFDANESAVIALGKKMEWGAVAESRWSPGVSDACDIGTFRQYGTAVYPEFDRKQVYKDNISDPIEIGPFQTIVAWVMDIEFVGFSEDELQHYSVTFTQGGTEIPVRLDDSNPIVGTVSESRLANYFPIECDISTNQAINVQCMTPDEVLRQAQRFNTLIENCISPKDAILASDTGAGYSGYIVPNMYQFGILRSCLNFNDASRWSYLGYDTCGGDPIDNIYEQTTAIMAMGCPLRNWYAVNFLGSTSYFYGIQTEHMVLDLKEGDQWVELDQDEFGADGGRPTYGLRFQAPPKATYSNDGGLTWSNPFYGQLGSLMESAIQGQSGYIIELPCWDYRPPGYLAGMNGGLYTVDQESFYAKISVSRPGIQFYGAGKDIRPLLRSLSFRAWPIYQYNMQQPIGVCGDAYPGGKVIDPSTGQYDANYCTQEDLSDSDLEELRENMTGVVLDYTISALFPTENSEQAYFDMGEIAKQIACMLYSYYHTFDDNPYKGYNFVCGPPKTQSEVPRLGETCRIPYSADGNGGVRTINSISYNYQDDNTFLINIEAGPAMVNSTGVGQLYEKQTENALVNGTVIQVIEGALYKVEIPGIGLVSAWNASKWPWDIGDSVQVELFNMPKEA